MEKQTGIWQKFKEDMKEANAKTATKHRNNMNQTKAEFKQVNSEAREKREAITAPTAKVSRTRKLAAVWVALFTAPLLLFAIVLFIIAMMFFWDAFIGL